MLPVRKAVIHLSCLDDSFLRLDQLHGVWSFGMTILPDYRISQDAYISWFGIRGTLRNLPYSPRSMGLGCVQKSPNRVCTYSGFRRKEERLMSTASVILEGILNRKLSASQYLLKDNRRINLSQDPPITLTNLRISHRKLATGLQVLRIRRFSLHTDGHYIPFIDKFCSTTERTHHPFRYSDENGRIDLPACKSSHFHRPST